MNNGVATVSLDDLIKAALTNQRYNQQRLGREAGRYSNSISRRRAPDLTVDLHEDVAQEAIAILFRNGPAALAGSTGKILLRDAVFDAIRVVRANHAPPGARSRPSADAGRARIAAEDVGRVVGSKELDRCTVGEGAKRSVDFDLFADTNQARAIQQIEIRLDVDTILGQAPGLVALSLRRIHVDGEKLEDVAAAAFISRFALNRQMKAFCKGWRMAA